MRKSKSKIRKRKTIKSKSKSGNQEIQGTDLNILILILLLIIFLFLILILILLPSPTRSYRGSQLRLHNLLQPSASLHALGGSGGHAHVVAARMRQLAVRVDAEQLVHAAEKVGRIYRPLLHLFPLRIR